MDNDNINIDNTIREKYKANTPGVRLTYDHVKSVFEAFGYELISDTYKNTKTKLQYVCKKHQDKGVQEISYGNLIHHSKCPYCMLEEGKIANHLPLEIYKEETEKHGVSFVDVYWNNSKTYINYICNKHKEKGIQTASFSSIKSSHQCCSYCNGTNRTTNDFKELLKHIHPNLEVLGEYTKAKARIKIRCTIHNHTWEPYAYNLLSGYGCKYCGHEKTGMAERIPQEVKLQRLKDRHGDDIEFLFIPELTDQKVKCRCNICGHEWEATYLNLSKPNATGCPKCRSSSGEKELQKILDKYNISYVSQKHFDDCKDIFTLPFDCYLLDYNCCIEYDGIQHYQPTNIGGMSDEEANIEFERTTRHDKMKTQYCLNNNIKLIRIPYWEKPNMELFLFKQFSLMNIVIN